MRIGSLTNISLLKWQPTDTRDVVIRGLPGYDAALSMDLNSSLRTHVIDGILTDSSNANLASDMEYLESLFRTSQLVWVDATDQYQALCVFGKIAKLQGPTIDSSTGQFVAKFTMEFWSLLPWGTTLFNPWKQAGFKMRDLDGIGAEYMLDPTQMHCNYTIDSTNKIVSWEFIIDNQNAFSGNQLVITQCDNTTNFAAYAGSGITISNDSTIFKQGTASVKVSGTSTSGGALGASYTPSSALNLSTYDFLVLWVRSDFGGNSTGGISIYAGNSGFSSYYQWNYTSLLANVWYRLVIPLRNPSSTTGTPSLSSIAEIEVQSTGQASAATNMWLDEINADIAQRVQLEFMMPDNISQSLTSLNISVWDGSSYGSIWTSGPVLEGEYQPYPGGFDYLDGSSMVNVYGWNNFWQPYPAGTIGTTVSYANSGYTGGRYSPLSVTITSLWGTNNRFVISVPLPPATSDSVSGNYPSNDLSGSQAINKIRIKIAVYFSNEDTTYSGFNSL